MRMLRLFILTGCLLGVACTLPAATLDEQLTAFRENDEATTEGGALALLKRGMAEHRAPEVYAALGGWLREHSLTSPESLFLAAHSAELAGDASDAVSHYRRLLSLENVPSAWIARAAPALYRLMLVRLRDVDGAYLYMRKNGERLRSHGNVRAYDSWFMEQALQRKDLAAMGHRLAAICNDSKVNAADYRGHLDAFLAQVETYDHDGEDLLAALAALGTAKATPQQAKDRLRWVALILPANAKVNELFRARKEVPESVNALAAKAAEILIRNQPYEGSLLVARGWCHYNDGHTPNYIAKTAMHREMKTKPLLEAMVKFTPEQICTFFASRAPRGRSMQALFSPAQMRAIAKHIPAAFNTLSAPDVALFDNQMTADEAKALAPNLARNPHRHAAVVRAVAAGGNSFQTVAQAILDKEIWRVDPSEKSRMNVLQFLWNSGLKRDGNFRDMETLYKRPNPRFEALARNVTRKAKPADRTAALETVLEDLLGGTPSLPGALQLFDQAVVNGTDKENEALLIRLTTPGQDDQAELLRRALGQARIANRTNLRYGPQLDSGWARGYRSHVTKALPKLAAHLRTRLGEQMKSGRLDPVLLGMWLRCDDPKSPEAVALMKSLASSPAWRSVPPEYRVLAGNRDYYYGRLKEAQLPDPVAELNRELLALKASPAADAVTAALKSVMDRLRQAPGLPGMLGLSRVASQPAACIPFADAIFVELAPPQFDSSSDDYRDLAQAIVEHLLKSKTYTPAQSLAPAFWMLAGVHGDRTLGGLLVKLTEAAMAAEDFSTASVLASVGLRFNPADSRHHHERDYRVALKKLEAQADEVLGVVEIPVQENEVGYRIFLSQKEYLQDNLDTAWALYDEHEEELLPVLRMLRHDYCFWLLERNVERGEVERVETLVAQLTLWDRRGNAGFSLAHQAALYLAYADVAFQKQAYGTARSWYRRVADNREFRGSRQQYRAILGSVAVDRELKNYEGALNELDKLMAIQDSSLRAQVHFARAEIFFVQEKYAEAGAEIDAVLSRDPQHADAVLLQGKVQIAKRDLVAPSKIRMGMRRSKKAIEPGERVEIDLQDPSLNVTGMGASIEVEARSASGDVETMILRPVGDSKSEYRAEIKTALGAPRKDDKVLQVLGRDTITYGFSRRFRQRMEDLPPDPEESVSIASDFHLAISSGDFPPREGERRLTIEELGLSTADRALGLGKVRPGNPIYVRVIDPDQSRSAKRDTVQVEVKSSSGDVIERFTLEETAAFSGEFEGAVPTAGGQAVAYAYSSEPGRDPNMAISSNKDYPAWEGQAGSTGSTKSFTIDLNDSVDLGKMTVECPAEKALTHFLVQTSLNGHDWEVRGVYPKGGTVPWDGRAQYNAVSTYGRGPGVPKPEGDDVPEDWREAMTRGQTDEKIGYAGGIVKNISSMKVGNISGHPGYSILLRFRAAFYQPEMAQRRFRLAGFPEGGEGTVFLIDGKPSDGDDPLVIDRELSPGVHEIEVWRNDNAANLNKARLLCDTGGEELNPCPDAMFDPTTFPPAIQQSLGGAATVEETQPGRFLILFGKSNRAQLVRLLIANHKGPAPAIKHITLDDTDETGHLPVAEDFRTLRKNQQLEVLPGDTVFVKYEDDLAYTERRTQQEKRLTVAFNTATIRAAFVDYIERRDGAREQRYEEIRRFRMDDDAGFAFLISDPDMDMSRERDAIRFKVRTSDGNSRDYKAYETEAHSGLFLGKVFPVSRAPQKETQIQLQEGGTLTAIYRDMENLDPGIPTDRSVTVEHAKYATPRFEVYSAVTEPLEEQLTPAKERANEKKTELAKEQVRPRIRLSSVLLGDDTKQELPLTVVYNSSVGFQVTAPHLALSPSSELDAYVQTETGRRAYIALRKKAEAEGTTLPPVVQPYDVNVPGTLKLTARPGDWGGFVMPQGYASGASPSRSRRSGDVRKSAVHEGRFNFSVPLALGDVPIRSFATQAAENLPSSVIPEALNVRPGDRIHIGFAYRDKLGNPQWHIATVNLASHMLLDVMDGDYQETLTSRFVGEKVFVRVIAPALDTSPERDEVTLQLDASSGATTPFRMRETFEHTGVFKGSFRLSYAMTEGAPGPVDPREFFQRGLPVRYSDTVTVSNPQALPSKYAVKINNGADGLVEPFSKRYTDGVMAIRTNFTLAECFFELAKMHREMGKNSEGVDGKRLQSLARKEMAHAKKLLEEALATHRDPEQQAHAEYLLGNLAQEYADSSVNEEIKRKGYMDALARFSRIPVDYPKATFASKAQYKKALVYEKMKQYDIAVEEYVKLAYKYPEDELIPQAMSRIGGFFQTRGLQQKKESDAKVAADDDAVKEEGYRLLDEANKNFMRAARIYTQLQERYPQHPLAGAAGVRGGQNLMRVGEFAEALAVLEMVYENEEYDGPDIRARAMYWSGFAHEKIAVRQQRGNAKREAFKLYNRIRFEYSASKWAKLARGRLASQDFAKLVEEDLKRREQAMEALKQR